MRLKFHEQGGLVLSYPAVRDKFCSEAASLWVTGQQGFWEMAAGYSRELGQGILENKRAYIPHALDEERLGWRQIVPLGLSWSLREVTPIFCVFLGQILLRMV